MSEPEQSCSQRLTTPQAARFCGCSASMLEKLRVAGTGPVYLKLGRRVVYDASDLETWLATEDDQPRPEFVSKWKAKRKAARQGATSARAKANGRAKEAGKVGSRAPSDGTSAPPKLKVGAWVRVTDNETKKTRIGEIVDVDARRARVAWRNGESNWVLRSKVTPAPKRSAA